MNNSQFQNLGMLTTNALVFGEDPNLRKTLELKLVNALQALTTGDAGMNEREYSQFVRLLRKFHEVAAKSPIYLDALVEAILQPQAQHAVLLDIPCSTRFLQADVCQISAEYATAIKSVSAENGAMLVIAGGITVHFYEEISTTSNISYPITKLQHCRSQTYAQNEICLYSASSEHIISMQALSTQSIVLTVQLASSQLYGNYNYFPLARPDDGGSQAFFARRVR